MKTRLVDFDVEKARNGAKVVAEYVDKYFTRPCRIVCYDAEGEFPIVALITDKCDSEERGYAFRLNGENNRYTLKIEEEVFEDGDIIAFGGMRNMNIGILKTLSVHYNQSTHYDYADLHYNVILTTSSVVEYVSDNMRLATEEEKQKLFYALAKEGKRWNPEKKCIEKLPRKTSEFKPFDKVLVRDKDDEEWRKEIFSNYDKTVNGDPFYRCLVAAWEQCIPYEGNESLLGTSNKPINL